jgi:hypothetical protein
MDAVSFANPNQAALAKIQLSGKDWQGEFPQITGAG